MRTNLLLFAKLYVKSQVKTPMVINGIAGHDTIKAYIIIIIVFKDSELQHKVYVVPCLKRSLILGNDFLVKEDCLINFYNRRIILRYTEFDIFIAEPFSEPEDDQISVSVFPQYNIEIKPKFSFNPYIVCAAETIFLNSPGYNYLPVTVNLLGCPNPIQECVFEWDSKFLNQHLIIGPEVLTTPLKLEKLVVASVGPQVRINKNTSTSTFIRSFKVTFITLRLCPLLPLKFPLPIMGVRQKCLANNSTPLNFP